MSTVEPGIFHMSYKLSIQLDDAMQLGSRTLLMDLSAPNTTNNNSNINNINNNKSNITCRSIDNGSFQSQMTQDLGPQFIGSSMLGRLTMQKKLKVEERKEKTIEKMDRYDEEWYENSSVTCRRSSSMKL